MTKLGCPAPCLASQSSRAAKPAGVFSMTFDLNLPRASSATSTLALAMSSPTMGEDAVRLGIMGSKRGRKSPVLFNLVEASFGRAALALDTVRDDTSESPC